MPLEVVADPAAGVQPGEAKVDAAQVEPRPSVADAGEQQQGEQQPVKEGKPGAQGVEKRGRDEEAEQDLRAAPAEGAFEGGADG